MYQPGRPPRPVIHRARPRRWPWILGTITGVVLAYFASLVIGLFIWFAAGGTFGGLGESASARIDWDEYDRLGAIWGVIPTLLAFAVPIDWQAHRVRWAEDALSRRRRTWVLRTLVATASVLVLGPGIAYVLGVRWQP